MNRPSSLMDLTHRPRRLRRSAAIRSLVRETRLSPDNFIYPLFAVPGQGQRREVGSMPGVFQMSVDEIVKEAAAAKADGVPGVLLFGLPASKDAVGSGAADPEGPVPSAVRALKKEVPGLLVVTDVCLCEYTSHGHCGIVDGEEIVNDATVEELARAALIARRRRRRHRRAVGHDGRPRRAHPREAGRRRLRAGRDHELRGQVLFRVLRPVPRSRGLGSRVRRSPVAPDGPGQRRGGAARGGARSGRRGRHRHGQARARPTWT